MIAFRSARLRGKREDVKPRKGSPPSTLSKKFTDLVLIEGLHSTDTRMLGANGAREFEADVLISDCIVNIK